MSRRSAVKKDGETSPKNILEALVATVDAYSEDYENLSKQLLGAGSKTCSYLEYSELGLKDEEKLVKPKLFRGFLTRVLGFKESDLLPESVNTNNRRPDISLSDTHLHPFAFEVKGMDSSEGDLQDEWVNKGHLYVEDDPNLRFLVITNMREFRVYGAIEGESDRFSLLNNLCFDLPDVYRWASNKIDDAAEDEPAPVIAFRTFTNIFRSKVGQLSLEQKLEDIFQAPPERPRKTSQKEIDAEKRKIREDLFSIIESFVDDLKVNQKSSLFSFYKRDNETKEKLEQEIGEIAISIEGHVANFEDKENLISKGKKLLKEYFDDGQLFPEEVNLFYRRTAYFTVFKLLLIRSWEDAEFIARAEWTLYDGGFQKWYHQSNKSIRRVLESAYGIAKNRYEWLFKDNNNYCWYYPNDDFAVDALWKLSKSNFASLNNDVLGSIYEEHLSVSAKKKIGLFYTHPRIVSLMWDIAGFKGEDAVVKKEVVGRKVEERLNRILDPCMGSGSFLCEGIRRILEVSGVYSGKCRDVKLLRKVKEGILSDVRGVELDPFAFFIAEINVLLMLTPLVKMIEEHSRGTVRNSETFATGLIPHDALQFYRNDEPGWVLADGKSKGQEKREFHVSNETLVFGRKRMLQKSCIQG